MFFFMKFSPSANTGQYCTALSLYCTPLSHKAPSVQLPNGKFSSQGTCFTKVTVISSIVSFCVDGPTGVTRDIKDSGLLKDKALTGFSNLSTTWSSITWLWSKTWDTWRHLQSGRDDLYTPSTCLFLLKFRQNRGREHTFLHLSSASKCHHHHMSSRAGWAAPIPQQLPDSKAQGINTTAMINLIDNFLPNYMFWRHPWRREVLRWLSSSFVTMCKPPPSKHGTTWKVVLTWKVNKWLLKVEVHQAAQR